MPSSTTRAERIAETLRHAIRYGDYKSGERLTEVPLAQEWNVSQNTIRDALYILEKEGWVEKKKRQGVFVRSFTRSEAEEVYILWATLEALALEWSLPTLEPHQINALHHNLQGGEQYIQTGQWHNGIEAIYSFHKMLSYTSGKKQTMKLLSHLRHQGRLLENIRLHQGALQPPAWSARLRYYFALMTALQNGDLVQAQCKTREAILFNIESVIPLLET